MSSQFPDPQYYLIFNKSHIKNSFLGIISKEYDTENNLKLAKKTFL